MPELPGDQDPSKTPTDATGTSAPFQDLAALMQVIAACSLATAQHELAALCDAIAALPEPDQVTSCLAQMQAVTGTSEAVLIPLSAALSKRMTAIYAAKATDDAKKLAAEIDTIDPAAIQSIDDLLPWVDRIAVIPDEIARDRLIGRLYHRTKINKRLIAKRVAEARGEEKKPAAAPVLTAGQLVKATLPGAPVPDALKIPEPYGIGSSGAIVRQAASGARTEVSSYPILIASEVTTRLGDTDLTRHKLVFRLPNGATGEDEWRELVADPATYGDQRKILSLANQRLPVTAATAKNVAVWLGELRNCNNGILPVIHSVPVAGWWWPSAKLQDESTGTPDLPDTDTLMFLWGHQVIARSGVAKQEKIRLEALDGDATNLQAAMHNRGALAAWIEDTWHLARERPVARMRLYASLASPLSRLVGAGGHVNHSSGHTTLGKTVVSQWAMSPWGCPGGPGMPDVPGLMRSWDMTKVGAERTFAFLNDIPAYLDDDPRTKGGNDNAVQQRVQDVVMTLANGIGRVRGSIDGKIQVTRRWHLVALSTNEQAIRDIVGRDGAAVRTIDLWGTPLVKVDEQGEEVAEDEMSMRTVADTLRAAAGRNYGWASAYLVSVLQHSIAELRSLFTTARTHLLEDLRKMLGENMGRLEARMIDYYAVMLVAAGIFHEETCQGTLAGGEGESQAAYQALLWTFRRLVQSNATAPTHEQLYDQLYGWTCANRQSFYGYWEDDPSYKGSNDSSPYQPSGGWFGKWRVSVGQGQDSISCFAVFQHRLLEFCNRAGHPAPTMLKLWRDSGILIPDSDGRNLARRVALESQKDKLRMYVFRRPPDDPDGDEQDARERPTAAGQDRF